MAQLHFRLDDGPRFARDQEFLTIAEAADLARCCQRTIRRAIDAGQLRAARLRGKENSRGAFRIARIDLENWMYGDAA
ncbi:MAG: helix-turn-helix domain-containing protein [Solirubrobacteraceae bacterium]